MKILLVITLLLVVPYSKAFAAIEGYQFKSQEMEDDYNQLINELRCLVCQNQNLAGSDADLARDLRRQTWEMLTQGNSRQQVVDFMVERYGDFVMYRPPLQRNTWILWLGPFVLLVIVLSLVFVRLRKAQALVAPDSEALQKAKSLLSNDEDKKEEAGSTGDKQ